MRAISSNGKVQYRFVRGYRRDEGQAWWTTQNHLRLITNDGTNLYYMYMHMSPTALAAANMKLGEAVTVVPGQR